MWSNTSPEDEVIVYSLVYALNGLASAVGRPATIACTSLTRPRADVKLTIRGDATLRVAKPLGNEEFVLSREAVRTHVLSAMAKCEHYVVAIQTDGINQSFDPSQCVLFQNRNRTQFRSFGSTLAYRMLHAADLEVFRNSRYNTTHPVSSAIASALNIIGMMRQRSAEQDAQDASAATYVMVKALATAKSYHLVLTMEEGGGSSTSWVLHRNRISRVNGPKVRITREMTDRVVLPIALRSNRVLVGKLPREGPLTQYTMFECAGGPRWWQALMLAILQQRYADHMEATMDYYRRALQYHDPAYRHLDLNQLRESYVRMQAVYEQGRREQLAARERQRREPRAARADAEQRQEPRWQVVAVRQGNAAAVKAATDTRQVASLPYLYDPALKPNDFVEDELPIADYLDKNADSIVITDVDGNNKMIDPPTAVSRLQLQQWLSDGGPMDIHMANRGKTAFDRADVLRAYVLSTPPSERTPADQFPYVRLFVAVQKPNSSLRGLLPWQPAELAMANGGGAKTNQKRKASSLSSRSLKRTQERVNLPRGRTRIAHVNARGEKFVRVGGKALRLGHVVKMSTRAKSALAKAVRKVMKAMRRV